MFNKNLVPWIIVGVLFISAPVASQPKCDSTKYKPGFSYFDGNTGEQVTLIKLEPDKIRPELKKQFPHMCPLLVWHAVIESTVYGVTRKTMIGESTIDMALGKAYAYHGRIIYYDSPEDCNSKAIK